ncbi:hypothetical protein B0H12DRAFT_1067180 [Mycena haematopus]|nr:hypothetical protein B0H12DRAFT_1067180 [Mycena haematopus]
MFCHAARRRPGALKVVGSFVSLPQTRICDSQFDALFLTAVEAGDGSALCRGGGDAPFSTLAESRAAGTGRSEDEGCVDAYQVQVVPYSTLTSTSMHSSRAPEAARGARADALQVQASTAPFFSIPESFLIRATLGRVKGSVARHISRIESLWTTFEAQPAGEDVKARVENGNGTWLRSPACPVLGYAELDTLLTALAGCGAEVPPEADALWVSSSRHDTGFRYTSGRDLCRSRQRGRAMRKHEAGRSPPTHANTPSSAPPPPHDRRNPSCSRTENGYFSALTDSKAALALMPAGRPTRVSLSGTRTASHKRCRGRQRVLNVDVHRRMRWEGGRGRDGGADRSVYGRERFGRDDMRAPRTWPASSMSLDQKTYVDAVALLAVQPDSISICRWVSGEGVENENETGPARSVKPWTRWNVPAPSCTSSRGAGAEALSTYLTRGIHTHTSRRRSSPAGLVNEGSGRTKPEHQAGHSPPPRPSSSSGTKNGYFAAPSDSGTSLVTRPSCTATPQLRRDDARRLVEQAHKRGRGWIAPRG